MCSSDLGKNLSGQLGIGTMTNVSTPTQVVCSSLSEVDFTDKSKISIDPNPSKGTINIRIEKNIDKIIIINILGKEVFESIDGLKQIDISNLKQGIYFIRIQSQGKTFIQKIIKE